MRNIAMGLLSRIMRFLFWLLILSWSVALLRRAVAWLFQSAVAVPQPETSGSSSNQGQAPRLLVRDPVCGMHVAEVLAVPLREGAETLHFCSMACRDKYIAAGQKKLASNG
jgi:YHS domain-containing protein